MFKQFWIYKLENNICQNLVHWGMPFICYIYEVVPDNHPTDKKIKKLILNRSWLHELILDRKFSHIRGITWLPGGGFLVEKLEQVVAQGGGVEGACVTKVEFNGVSHCELAMINFPTLFCISEVFRNISKHLTKYRGYLRYIWFWWNSSAEMSFVKWR